MARDPDEYPEPESFKPERFIKPDETLNDDNVRHIFGFGRPLCSGHHLPDVTVWMAIASVLAVFRLVHVKDEYGHEGPVEAKNTSPLVSRPLPFKCAFEPRDEKARALLAQLQDQEDIE
ncbi:cytochrome P450-like protein [Dentipellis sp. KUC8613]|nr:cytochrome P450-like protein [Dentipellis sp. KUC8613]